MSLTGGSSGDDSSMVPRIVAHASSLEELTRALESVPGITRVVLRDKVVKTYPPQREFEIDWGDEGGTHRTILAVSESLTAGSGPGYAYVGMRPLADER